MSGWEDDDYVPEVVAAVGGAAVQSYGDAEFSAEVKETEEARGPAAPMVLKPKHEAKLRMKEAEERAANERRTMAAAAAAAAAAGDAPLADPAAEKRRQMALQARSEAEAFAAEAMGMGGNKSGSLEIAVAALPLSDDASYKTLGKAIATRVFAGSPGGKLYNVNAMHFFTDLVAVAGDALSTDDLQKLEQFVGAQRNKKIQAEKSAKPGGKKKAGGAKFGGAGREIDGAALCATSPRPSATPGTYLRPPDPPPHTPRR